MNAEELDQLDRLLKQASSILEASLDRRLDDKELAFQQKITLLRKALLKMKPERIQTY